MKYIPLLLLALSLTACESSDEKALKEFVSSQFKDPQSTQFQKVAFKNGVMCGEVNSKNSYGAYTGFKRFFAKGGKSYPQYNFSNVEDEGVFGVNDSGQALISMKIQTYLMMKRADVARSRAGLPPMYDKEVLDPILAKYSELIISLKPEELITEDGKVIGSQVSKLGEFIAFEESFKASCPSF